MSRCRQHRRRDANLRPRICAAFLRISAITSEHSGGNHWRSQRPKLPIATRPFHEMACDFGWRSSNWQQLPAFASWPALPVRREQMSLPRPCGRSRLAWAAIGTASSTLPPSSPKRRLEACRAGTCSSCSVSPATPPSSTQATPASTSIASPPRMTALIARL